MSYIRSVQWEIYVQYCISENILENPVLNTGKIRPGTDAIG